ncbi:hypothetical protein N7493_003854 [Penicillium malachiteum]|uniref:Uncharacterized protein n=1 Tax=Penicillium malachiteum TaxID=1324776 RepID=A0AAD6HQH1_9EURO|nr:hypothetical protein N7493_003854 [Penicillium malachiteum]
MPGFGFHKQDSCQIRFLGSGDETPSYAPTPGHYGHAADSIECLSPDLEQLVNKRPSPFPHTYPNYKEL